MQQKRHSVDQIISKLQKADVELGKWGARAKGYGSLTSVKIIVILCCYWQLTV